MPEPRTCLVRSASPTLAVLAMVALTGCGLLATAPGAEVVPADAAAPASMSTPEAGTPGPTPSTMEADAALLGQGEALLLAGRFEEAVAALETFLVFGEDPAHRRRATWSLALAHLLPQSPLRQQARALDLLASLEEGHPGTMEAVQAAWLQALLRESARERSTLEAQEETIRELNELVEQLKRIDLNRRPPGGG